MAQVCKLSQTIKYTIKDMYANGVISLENPWLKHMTSARNVVFGLLLYNNLDVTDYGTMYKFVYKD